MNVSQVAGKIKAQIAEISGILSKGMAKKTKKFVEEMIFGIQAKQSMRLSQISRSLEEKIAIRKTENRLCRQLKREDLGRLLSRNLVQEACTRIKPETLIILDLSDIKKKFAKQMEYLGQVRDGSEGEIVDGYWTLQVIATELEEVKITPLYADLYSAKAPDFGSENEQILKAVDETAEAVEGRGIWVIDRGGDRINIMEPLLKKNLRFIIRSTGERYLVYRGGKVLAHELAQSCLMRYAERIVKEEEKQEKVYTIEFGYRKVKLPGCSQQLYLVVVRGFGSEPMMLLTNVAVTKSRQSLLKIVLAYVRRWQIEESIRFVKQSYQLEDIRLLTYKRLKNMMSLVLAVMYFACVWMGDRLRLSVLAHHALRAAKRLFGIPNFRFYAIADGIREIFAGYKSHQDPSKIPKIVDPQLVFTLT